MMTSLILLFGVVMLAVGCLITYFLMQIKTTRLINENARAQGRMEAIFLNAPAEIYLKDEQGRYVMINPEFERLFNVQNKDVVGFLPTDIHDEEMGAKTRAHDLQVLSNQKTVIRDEIALTSKGIRTLHTIKFPTFDDDGTLTGIGAIVTDITDRRAVETQLRQFQKMEAIGQLTGGIAHDFNNLLAVIMGNLELIELSSKDEISRACIKDALTATERGAELTKNLLSFARKSPLSPVNIDLHDLIDETQRWGQRVIPSNIDVKTSIPDDIWTVSLDKTMAQTALLNIILNAKDAMLDGGCIELNLSNVDMDHSVNMDNDDGLLSGQFVRMEIRDNGTGIKPDLLDEIFTPFFTTKPVGSGSGLGLSMVQGFIKQSNGFMNISSKEGEGTTVHLYFKAASSVAKVKSLKSKQPKTITVSKGRILIAEDDEGVRNWLTRHFEMTGSNVTTAETGDDALALFRKAPDDFDLIISDIIMPGTLQGPSLILEVRKIRPHMPVIFLSGYTKDKHRYGPDYFLGETFLMKPVGSRELTEAVNVVMSGDITRPTDALKAKKSTR
jgi:PAS domain S-box-containing protein